MPKNKVTHSAKYKEDIRKKYFDKNMSFAEIAEHYKTYAGKIRRDFLSMGFTPRSHSEAQAIAINKDGREHPTKGKKRSKETLDKISLSLSKNWENLSEKEKERRTKLLAKNYTDMSEKERKEFHDKATQGILKAAKEGSKIEKAVNDMLVEAGYPVEFHRTHLLANTNLELDLFLPRNGIAIEVDGPTHFDPTIWGEERLAKTVDKDNEKNGLLLGLGFHVIRLRYTQTKFTNLVGIKIKEILLPEIAKLENKRKAQLVTLEV